MMSAIKILVAVSAAFLFPASAFAATVYFDAPPRDTDVYVGDTFAVGVILSSPDKIINAADGYIEFDNKILEVKEVSTGGSIFSVWARVPQFSNDEGKITFVGGAPGGFTNGEGDIFKIIFYAKSAGTAKLDFNDNFLLFMNDGLGTKLGPGLRPRDVTVSERPSGVPPKDEWQDILAKDTLAPAEFDILIGKDPAVFENKYFISFQTTDKHSGIDHYEVKEGEGEFVRAESPYALKNQQERDLIWVKAVDKAGNERVVRFAPEKKTRVPYVVGLLIVIGFLLAFIWRVIIRKVKK